MGPTGPPVAKKTPPPEGLAILQIRGLMKKCFVGLGVLEIPGGNGPLVWKPSSRAVGAEGLII